MKKLKLIIEKNEDGYWGRIDKIPSVFSFGVSIEDLIENTQEALELYFEELNRSVPKYEFELVMDIREFFSVNDYIKISTLAKKIGMNSSLLRQYAKGLKYPSLKQVERIESAIKQIGNQLIMTNLHPG